MIVLQAVWTDAALHLWGQRCAETARDGGGPGDTSDGSVEPATARLVPVDDLRSLAGDLWDTLLVSGATSSHLTLRLPHLMGNLLSPRDPCGSRKSPSDDAAASLLPCRVETLAFSAADAVDLLTSIPTFEREEIHVGASLRYWSRAADLVLELLAHQRFVPSVHRGSDDRYLGYWRVVVDEQKTSDRLRALIVSMPPVCRSHASDGAIVQASRLVENFLWASVDSLVRRCLEGDELAHGVQDTSAAGLSKQMRWLRALVGSSPALLGTPDECQAVREAVGGWISKLHPGPAERTCRTCFRLHPPPVSESQQRDDQRLWKLTLHVQAAHNPSLVLDARDLRDDRQDEPAILKRPFQNAVEQLRADLEHAARHFPPLAPCAEPAGPLECSLTLEEAYSFLRNAAPVLEAEGFPVWVPPWWQGDRPRLRMRLDIRPLAGAAPVQDASMGLDAIIAFDWRVALGDDSLSLDEIAQLAVAKAPLVRFRDRWAEVQPSDLETAMKFLEDNPAGKMTVFEALRLSYIADDFDTGLPMAGIRAHDWIERLLNATTVNDAIEHTAQPAGFRGTLRRYQRRGLDWLSFLSRHGLGACLADDMGLGKTIQMIAVLLHEREAGTPCGPTLLIVPMSLVGNWGREIAKFAPSLKVMVHHGLERLTGDAFVAQVAEYDVVISTYGLAHRDHEHLSEVQWHRVALDEAQNIKNPAAKQSVAVRSLGAVHRVALTGTPVENRLSDLWSIIDFLIPGYLGRASEFRRRFAMPIERHHDTDRSQRLRELIRPFVLRRMKDDPDIATDLPEKLEMTVYCNLTPEQAALYEGIVGNMLGQIDQSQGIQRKGLVLAAIVKLKQVCNHPAQLLADGSAIAHRSGKCDRLTEMLEEVVAEDHRALVFTQFRQMGHLLKKHLQEALDREILFLHGGTARKQRDELVERFQSGDPGTPILLMTLKAGGFGLNLTAANHVFHYDRWWNPAVESQATDRAHRIGQEKRVQVHKYVCLGTLEERIAAVLESKKALADRVVGSGEDWLTELSTEQLRDMFALSSEAVAQD